ERKARQYKRGPLPTLRPRPGSAEPHAIRARALAIRTISAHHAPELAPARCSPRRPDARVEDVFPAKSSISDRHRGWHGACTTMAPNRERPARVARRPRGGKTHELEDTHVRSRCTQVDQGKGREVRRLTADGHPRQG